MTIARKGHTATLLADGRVLVAGGWPVPESQVDSLVNAEWYDPPTGQGGLFAISNAPMLLSVSGDGTGQGAIQHAGTYQVVSSANPAVAGEALAIYSTGLIDGSGIIPQISIGGRMADVFWFGDTPGYSSLNQVNVRVPGGVAPSPAAPLRVEEMEAQRAAQSIRLELERHGQSCTEAIR